MTTTNEAQVMHRINASRGALSFANMHQADKHPAKLELRKWLSSNGVPSTYAARLSFAELESAWNDTSDASLNILKLSQPAATNGHASYANHEEPATMTVTVNPDHAKAAHAANAAHAAPSSNPLDGLMAYINAHIAGSVNEDRVRAIVDEAMNGVAPRRIEIHQPGKLVMQMDERTNPVFERVLKLVSLGENVLIVGPAGCGKTHLAQQVAKALDRRFGMISGSAGASESQLMGWLLPSDGGKFEYRASDFVECYEGGNSLFLMDEFDGFDGNMLMCLNSPLAGGPLFIPQRVGNPHIKRGENVSIICTANTYGTGADPIYAGRNQLDGATLDRFMVVEMTYDAALESDIGKAGGLKADQLERFFALRSKVEKAGLLRVISTRALKKIISNMRCGMDYGAALQDLTTGWSADEKQRVGF